MNGSLFRLDGKTALITGAAQGIGRGIAEVFCDAGASVFFCDIDVEKGERCVREFSDVGRTIRFFHADVTDESAMKAFAAEAVNATRRIDILVHNASCTIGAQHDILGADEEEWIRNFRIGMMGMQYLSAAALPAMISAGGGAIVIISSIQALAGCPSSVAYTSIKAAQLGFMKSAAVDYGRHNIRVNAICPGPITVWYSPPPGSDLYNWQVANTMLGRVAVPREIGYAALFLASDEGSFVTGVTLPVDGGWTAKG